MMNWCSILEELGGESFETIVLKKCKLGVCVRGGKNWSF